MPRRQLRRRCAVPRRSRGRDARGRSRTRRGACRSHRRSAAPRRRGSTPCRSRRARRRRGPRHPLAIAATSRSPVCGSTSLSRREISKAGASRRMPVSSGSNPSRRKAALLSHTLCTSALMRYVGVSPVAASRSSRVGTSDQKASRNPVPTRRPSRIGAAAMRDAACAAEVACPSGARWATSAHCMTCTWWSHRPGISHAPPASSTRPRAGSAPAGAMSAIRPLSRKTSKGPSSGSISSPGPTSRADVIVPTVSPTAVTARGPSPCARGASPRRAQGSRTGHRRSVR